MIAEKWGKILLANYQLDEVLGVAPVIDPAVGYGGVKLECYLCHSICFEPLWDISSSYTKGSLYKHIFGQDIGNSALWLSRSLTSSHTKGPSVYLHMC